MSRGTKKIPKRKIEADPIYNSVLVAKFINKIMKGGKKSVAQKIVYQALENLKGSDGQDPLEVFQKALANVTPSQEVRSRRVGGANYQVPVPVRRERGEALAIRWVIEAARSKKGKPMATDLVEELQAAVQGQGDAFKKKMDVHRMAEANRAFAHFRW